MELAELRTNANKALDGLLNTRGTIEAIRQRAIWDLGVMLCQNESQAATMVKEAQGPPLSDGPRHLDSLLPVSP